MRAETRPSAHRPAHAAAGYHTGRQSGAALAVKLAGPILAAAAEIVYVLLILVAAIASGAAAVVGIATWRWRRRRLDAARAEVPANSFRSGPSSRSHRRHGPRSSAPASCTCTCTAS